MFYAHGWGGQRFYNVCRFFNTKCNTFVTSKNFLTQGNEREVLLILPYIWFIKKSKLWKMERWIGIPMNYNLINFYFFNGQFSFHSSNKMRLKSLYIYHFSYLPTQVTTQCNDKIKSKCFLDLQFLVTQILLVSRLSTTQPYQWMTILVK
jgi:hypothetical protein